MLIILLVSEHFDWKINRQDGTGISCDIIYSCHVLKQNAVSIVYLFIYLFYKVAKFESMNNKGK